MSFVRTINNAYYDYGENNYIPKNKVCEVLEHFHETKYVVMYNGFKRIIKKEDVIDVYVLLCFPSHQRIRKFYISSYDNLNKLNYLLIPKCYPYYNEGCLNEYKEMCLKVLNDDLKNARRCALNIKNTIHYVLSYREP